MVFFVLDPQSVVGILKKAGYSVGEDLLQVNLDYYLARTSHGSTLSRLVHAYLTALVGYEELSWQLYMDALSSDYVDIQGGTTKEGIHTGVMAGTVVQALRAYAGLGLDGEELAINPCLPATWRSMRFNVRWRRDRFHFVVKPESVQAKLQSSRQEASKIHIQGRAVSITNGSWQTVALERDCVS